MAQEVRRVGARRTASLVLVVLGTVLLFVGGIALYVREEIFDPDAFAQHASESLGDDRVDAAVANPIVDEVIKVGPDQLINGRPLLTAAARGVLGSEPFREAFRDAAARVHRMMAEKRQWRGLDPLVPRRIRAHAGDALHVRLRRRVARSEELQAEPRHRRQPAVPVQPLGREGASITRPRCGGQRVRLPGRAGKGVPARRGLLPNLVAVDFYDEGDIFEASRKLNGLPRDAEPKVRETG